jgi:sporulation protein YlmC with PRC-barrel domain
MILSSTSLQGNNVCNTQGDDLGQIEDFMLNTNSGNVEYAVLSFGGFMGIGDKLFAVPLDAMQLDTEKHRFVLNESKARLETAPGFDKDHWPNMADGKWANEVRTFYRL